MTKEEQVAGNQPVKKVRNGAFNASVFKNTGTDKDGKEFSYDSIVLQRGYNKGTEDKPEWINEKINLRANDIQKVKSVLDEVYNFLAVKDEE